VASDLHSGNQEELAGGMAPISEGLANLSREPTHGHDAATILLVDDDSALLHLVQEHLAEHGYQTHGVTSGAAALDWLETHSARLMLLDYVFPDMFGDEILQRLQDRGIQVPFVVVTGHGNEALAVAMMKRGARDYLLKDGSYLKLLPTVVERVLSQLQQEQQLRETEAKLRQSEEEFRQFAENSREVFWQVTPDFSRPLYVSPAYEEFTGRPRQELFDSDTAWLEPLHPADRERLRNAFLAQPPNQIGRAHV
jgi:FixJ family two-component response regulator